MIAEEFYDTLIYTLVLGIGFFIFLKSFKLWN